MVDAVDTTTGQIAWKFEIPQPNKSGFAVAGDLVFYGENNGLFHALDATTGATLWTFDGTSVENGGGSAAGPAAYVVNGKEFIVNAFGGNRIDRDLVAVDTLVGDALIAFGLPEAEYTGPNVVYGSTAD